jgi:hypothetical protein
VPKACSDYPTAKLDKRVAIQSATQSTDGQGGFTETWTTDATVWAWIRPVKGFEKFQAMQTQTPVAAWDRAQGLRYNNATQQSLYPGDRGLEYVEQSTDKQIYWGQPG